jgi:pimeloyl-ACP methyl ester carboxylesterase
LFAKEKTFAQLFAEVPEEQKQKLISFREQAGYKTILIDGNPWRYRALGESDPCMILLPGAFTLADSWMNVAALFSAKYRILMPDAYARQGVYEADQVCEAILGMMAAEQVKQAIFIGLAAGGDMAQYFLHKHPERVADLVLSHCDILGDSALMDDIRMRNTLNFYRRTPEKMIRKMLLRPLAKDLPAESEWRQYTLAYYQESMQGLKKKMVIGHIVNSSAMKNKFEFMDARIRTWQGDLLYLASDDDPISVGSIPPLKKFYPSAKIQRFSKGKNHVHLVYAQQVYPVIDRFLAHDKQNDSSIL